MSRNWSVTVAEACLTAGMAPTRVLIADAQFLVADSLGTALEARAGLTVLDDRPREGIETLRAVTTYWPEFVLLDYWLPDMEGSAVIRELVARAPETKVLTLSWFHGPKQVQDALQAGAVGFLPKSLSVDRVAEAIARAQQGENPVFAEELAELVGTIANRAAYLQTASTRFANLTVRELEILRLLGAGLSSTAIARRLYISHATVRTHVTRILSKIDANSQLEAVAMAREEGLVS